MDLGLIDSEYDDEHSIVALARSGTLLGVQAAFIGQSIEEIKFRGCNLSVIVDYMLAPAFIQCCGNAATML